MKYSMLYLKQKKILEQMMADAGKKMEDDEPLAPEKEIALGNKYNDQGWELQNGKCPDMEGAIKWYKEAAELGNSTAMVNLGNICEARGDLREAFEWYRNAADAGDDKGRFNMARMFFHGEGVEQSYGWAYRFFCDLYERDYPGVCLYMGLYAENGFLEKPAYEAAVVLCQDFGQNKVRNFRVS